MSVGVSRGVSGCLCACVRVCVFYRSVIKTEGDPFIDRFIILSNSKKAPITGSSFFRKYVQKVEKTHVCQTILREG